LKRKPDADILSSTAARERQQSSPPWASKMRIKLSVIT
jgi:hypothetical protein